MRGVFKVGKITSVYLTDEEVVELKKFCEENKCTQYSALKTALKELLHKPMEEKTKPPIIPEIKVIEKSPEKIKAEQKQKRTLRQLLEYLKQKES